MDKLRMYIANLKVATKYNQKMYRGETWNTKNILQRKKLFFTLHNTTHHWQNFAEHFWYF